MNIPFGKLIINKTYYIKGEDTSLRGTFIKYTSTRHGLMWKYECWFTDVYDYDSGLHLVHQIDIESGIEAIIFPINCKFHTFTLYDSIDLQ
jgi:hypothetical protein